MPMRYDPDRHHRRSIRLRGYDYRQTGAYFVTLCSFQRECIFGEVTEDGVLLTGVGRIVQECWAALPEHFPFIALDSSILMPNHLHGVLFRYGVDGLPTAPTPMRPAGTAAGSLGAVIQSFKAMSTRRANAERGTPGYHLWQRNYYEHIIRDEEDLNRIREYILANPGRWAEDAENPLNIPGLNRRS